MCRPHGVCVVRCPCRVWDFESYCKEFRLCVDRVVFHGISVVFGTQDALRGICHVWGPWVVQCDIPIVCGDPTVSRGLQRGCCGPIRPAVQLVCGCGGAPCGFLGRGGGGVGDGGTTVLPATQEAASAGKGGAPAPPLPPPPSGLPAGGAERSRARPILGWAGPSRAERRPSPRRANTSGGERGRVGAERSRVLGGGAERSRVPDGRDRTAGGRGRIPGGGARARPSAGVGSARSWKS